MNDSINELCDSQISSSYFVEQTRRINIYLTLFIIVAGLAGNCLACLVYLQKKIRSKTTSIYLLALTTSDSLYLLVHFFEDTLKTYISIFFQI